MDQELKHNGGRIVTPAEQPQRRRKELCIEYDRRRAKNRRLVLSGQYLLGFPLG